MSLTEIDYSVDEAQDAIKRKISEFKNNEAQAERLAKKARMIQQITFKQYEAISREDKNKEFTLCGQDPYQVAERYQKLILAIKEEVDIETAITAMMRDNPQPVINALIQSLNHYIEKQLSLAASCREKIYTLKHQLNLFEIPANDQPPSNLTSTTDEQILEKYGVVQ